MEDNVSGGKETNPSRCGFETTHGSELWWVFWEPPGDPMQCPEEHFSFISSILYISKGHVFIISIHIFQMHRILYQVSPDSIYVSL